MPDARRFRRAAVRVASVAWLLVLAACTTQAPRPTLPAVAGDPAAHQQQRAAALAGVPDWALSGRVALSNGREGGSGRIDWQQDGSHYDVSLSAPVTRQSWRLRGEPGQALLEGLGGGPRQGPDARLLLLEATRWDIPVEALSAWVRGVSANESYFGDVDAVFGGDGRLSRLMQDGWTIAYDDWQAVPGQPAELPHRLTATRGEARVRLVVDAWQTGR